jgi:predicted Fe-S protein YdhL (DUF1289 family)
MPTPCLGLCSSKLAHKALSTLHTYSEILTWNRAAKALLVMLDDANLKSEKHLQCPHRPQPYKGA